MADVGHFVKGYAGGEDYDWWERSDDPAISRRQLQIG